MCGNITARDEKHDKKYILDRKTEPHPTLGNNDRSVQLVVDLLTAVFQRKKWVVCWKWLGRRDIQSGCSDLSAGQSLIKILLVHHSSSKTIMSDMLVF